MAKLPKITETRVIQHLHNFITYKGWIFQIITVIYKNMQSQSQMKKHAQGSGPILKIGQKFLSKIQKWINDLKTQFLQPRPYHNAANYFICV